MSHIVENESSVIIHFSKKRKKETHTKVFLSFINMAQQGTPLTSPPSSPSLTPMLPPFSTDR